MCASERARAGLKARVSSRGNNVLGRARSASVVTQMTSKRRERASLRPATVALALKVHNNKLYVVEHEQIHGWLSHRQAVVIIINTAAARETAVFFHADIQISGRVAFYARTYYTNFCFLSPFAGNEKTEPASYSHTLRVRNDFGGAHLEESTDVRKIYY